MALVHKIVVLKLNWIIGQELKHLLNRLIRQPANID